MRSDASIKKADVATVATSAHGGKERDASRCALVPFLASKQNSEENGIVTFALAGVSFSNAYAKSRNSINRGKMP